MLLTEVVVVALASRPASSQSGSSTITLNAAPGGAAEVTVTATPDTNHGFLNWTDANGKVLARTQSYTFTPAGAINLTAHFNEMPAGDSLFIASQPIRQREVDVRKRRVGQTSNDATRKRGRGAELDLKRHDVLY
jgi:Divergent InlB B-repeat domain